MFVSYALTCLFRFLRPTVLCLLLTAASSVCAQSSLPKVYLNYSRLDTDKFYSAFFSLVDGEVAQDFNIGIRHRGDLSSIFDKPSYAIKLYDNEGVKTDASFLELREDNYWILDAMAADVGRVRNRVSMNLWLEFSHRPWYAEQEPNMVNGYHGKMVELYVNNTFQGLYCLNERVDRKQLKLKKYSEKKGIQGVMYKSNDISKSTQFMTTDADAPTDVVDTWDGWSVKYPDLKDGDPITWQPLRNLIDFVSLSSKERFSNEMAEYFDLPVLVDYFLFVELLYAGDNIRKNMIVSFYNNESKMALLTPWDLDISWGRNYVGFSERADRHVYYTSRLFTRLVDECDWFVKAAEDRWAVLRQSFFTVDHIDSLFDYYFDLYAETGIDTREEQLWNGVGNLSVSFAKDRDFIHSWVTQRLEFLDDYFHYNSSTTNVSNLRCDNPDLPVKTIRNGKIVIIRNGEMFDIIGRKVK